MILQNKIQIINRRLIFDERGWFLKAITGIEKNIPNSTGEVYLTMAKPGETRGGHFHLKALEWFTIIEGEAILKLEDIITKEKLKMKISFNDAVTVFVPNNVAHLFYNESNSNFILLAYSDLLYDPLDTIIYNL